MASITYTPVSVALPTVAKTGETTNPAGLTNVGGSTSLNTNDGATSYVEWDGGDRSTSKLSVVEIAFGAIDLSSLGILEVHTIARMTDNLGGGFDGTTFAACGVYVCDGGGNGIIVQGIRTVGAMLFPEGYAEIPNFSEGWGTVYDQYQQTSSRVLNTLFDPSTGVYVYIICQSGFGSLRAQQWTHAFLRYTPAGQTPDQTQPTSPFLGWWSPKQAEQHQVDATGTRINESGAKGLERAMLLSTGNWISLQWDSPTGVGFVKTTSDGLGNAQPAFILQTPTYDNIYNICTLPDYTKNQILVQYGFNSDDFTQNFLEIWKYDPTGKFLSKVSQGLDVDGEYILTGGVYQNKIYYVRSTNSNLGFTGSYFPDDIICTDLSTGAYETLSQDVFTASGAAGGFPMSCTVDSSGVLWVTAADVDERELTSGAGAGNFTLGFVLYKCNLDGTIIDRYDFWQSTSGARMLTGPIGEIVAIPDGRLAVGLHGVLDVTHSPSLGFEADGCWVIDPATLTPDSADHGAANELGPIFIPSSNSADAGSPVLPLLAVSIPPPLRMQQRDDGMKYVGHARLNVNNNLGNQSTSWQFTRAPRINNGGNSYT